MHVPHNNGWSIDYLWRYSEILFFWKFEHMQHRPPPHWMWVGIRKDCFICHATGLCHHCMCLRTRSDCFVSRVRAKTWFARWLADASRDTLMRPASECTYPNIRINCTFRNDRARQSVHNITWGQKCLFTCNLTVLDGKMDESVIKGIKFRLKDR